MAALRETAAPIAPEEKSHGRLFALGEDAPQLGDGAWVAPGAQLIGRVILRQDASVWFNAILRGDNDLIEIGTRSNVQDGAVLHVDPGFPLTVGANCTIGHSAIVHGCTIGDGALIGMGATVLNGAVIGSGCLVGANALVTEGKTFPPNSLILGAPAKAVRMLDAEAVEGLSATAGRYVDNARRFQKGLRPI